MKSKFDILFKQVMSLILESQDANAERRDLELIDEVLEARKDLTREQLTAIFLSCGLTGNGDTGFLTELAKLLKRSSASFSLTTLGEPSHDGDVEEFKELLNNAEDVTRRLTKEKYPTEWIFKFSDFISLAEMKDVYSPYTGISGDGEFGIPFKTFVHIRNYVNEKRQSPMLMKFVPSNFLEILEDAYRAACTNFHPRYAKQFIDLVKEFSSTAEENSYEEYEKFADEALAYVAKYFNRTERDCYIALWCKAVLLWSAYPIDLVLKVAKAYPSALSIKRMPGGLSSVVKPLLAGVDSSRAEAVEDFLASK